MVFFLHNFPRRQKNPFLFNYNPNPIDLDSVSPVRLPQWKQWFLLRIPVLERRQEMQATGRYEATWYIHCWELRNCLTCPSCQRAYRLSIVIVKQGVSHGFIKGILDISPKHEDYGHSHINMGTIDPWKTWVSTAQVHLYADFCNKYCKCIFSPLWFS